MFLPPLYSTWLGYRPMVVVLSVIHYLLLGKVAQDLQEKEMLLAE